MRIPLPTRTAPSAGRSRRSPRSLPLAAGALVAAAGLTFGGLAAASAQDATPAHHGAPASTSSTAAPRHGDAIPNVTLVENQIKAYYGSVAYTAPAPIGPETLPSPDGNYAKEVRGIEAHAQRVLQAALRHEPHGHAAKDARKPALVFDVDDTTLNTYNYEIATQFGYTPASNATFVNAEAFPAVFGMPDLVDWASTHGFTVFFLTGRPVSQRDATQGNLEKVGYTAPADATHLYLKDNANPPAYLPCGATCTTIQYKSGTRAHIESLGYRIVGNFGDQYSDLRGGYAQYTFKLPNPMYYLP